MKFGTMLRELRANKRVGIKRLAPDLGVSYSYLSKLENNEARPSEEFIERVAIYFECDAARLMLAADRVPPDILDILRNHPDDAIEFLRMRFGRNAKH